MPDALAGPRIERHDARREQVVAEPMAAVPVVCRRLGRQIDDAALVIGRQHRPDAAVAAVSVGTVFPGIGAEFAVLRHDMERP